MLYGLLRSELMVSLVFYIQFSVAKFEFFLMANLCYELGGVGACVRDNGMKALRWRSMYFFETL